MRIDYDKIKGYLEIFVESDKPYIDTTEILDKMNYDSNLDSDLLEASFYMNLLNDQTIIECIYPNVENMGFSFTGNGRVILRVTNFRMTYLGHQTYEAMNHSKIWSKINSAILKLGEEGIKQIPALGMKLITDNI